VALNVREALALYGAVAGGTWSGSPAPFVCTHITPLEDEW